MIFTGFEIANYRGIQHVAIKLSGAPSSHVYTLVGLNESGKTTVLEAINHFQYKTESLEPLELKGYSITDPHSLIPIASRSNFNGDIVIKVSLRCEERDESIIRKALGKKLGFTMTKPLGDFSIEQRIAFKNSQHDKASSKLLWTANFVGCKKYGKKAKALSGDDWQEAAQIVRPLIPSILYFPNFLFDFPDRIYLEDTGVDDKLHAFYRLVLQDILDSLANDTKLETHVLARSKSGDRNDKKNLDGLLLQMSRHVTHTVFDSWNRMFQQKMRDKKIIIVCDTDENGHTYIEMKLEDADGYYLISERSLGFRWFFVFLLLTQYRGFRRDTTSGVLFLFDEPASNLHATAQAQLLESFRTLSSTCRIIYTTHSHHLINPDWLEGTFVVRNAGLDYGTEVSQYSAQKTNIKVVPYRQFVTDHPDQTSYYKPILDVLEYIPSSLDPVQDVIMVEGKNDYFVLRLAQIILGSPFSGLTILPGMGSCGLDVPIKLYIAWGKKFVVLLDSDKEGERQKSRYQSTYETLVANRILSLADVDPSWKGMEIEHLFMTEERIAIQQASYSGDTEYNKSHFNRSIQESLLTGRYPKLQKDTRSNLEKLLSTLHAKLISK